MTERGVRQLNIDLSLNYFGGIAKHSWLRRLGHHGGKPMPSSEPQPLITQTTPPRDIFTSKPDITPNDPVSIDKWKRAKAEITFLEGGEHADGTAYDPGRVLRINRQDVMYDFESKWCKVTVDEMFKDMHEVIKEDRNLKEKPLVVVERGYGLGIMSRNILQKMLYYGGEYHIIELNDKVYEAADQWAKDVREAIGQMNLPRPLSITVHHGDADQILEEKFGKESIDLLFSDTHQLVPKKRGFNDLLRLEELKKRLRPNGRFTFCAFYKGNQNGKMDPHQISLLGDHFRGYRVIRQVDVVPHPRCRYMKGPKAKLPVVICTDPILEAA